MRKMKKMKGQNITLNNFLTKKDEILAKQLSDLKAHLDIAIYQLKNGQDYILTKSAVMANLLILLGMEEVEKVYNDIGEIKYYCKFPTWF